MSPPLDRLGGSVLNPRRGPPVFHPAMRGGRVPLHKHCLPGAAGSPVTPVATV
jgi:hypothetical protein